MKKFRPIRKYLIWLHERDRKVWRTENRKLYIVKLNRQLLSITLSLALTVTIVWTNKIVVVRVGIVIGLDTSARQLCLSVWQRSCGSKLFAGKQFVVLAYMREHKKSSWWWCCCHCASTTKMRKGICTVVMSSCKKQNYLKRSLYRDSWQTNLG